jgi:hypothetical protein
MRFTPSILLGAAMILPLVGAASAESPQLPSAIEASEFARHVGVRLDDEFERSVGRVGDLSLSALAGPSSMQCRYMRVQEGRLDTCVVTVPGIPAVAPPAALAQN